MIRLTETDGKRLTLTQWDVDRQVLVTGLPDGIKAELHCTLFRPDGRPVFTQALSVVLSASEDGYVGELHNTLLQFAGVMEIAVFDGNATRARFRIPVKPRQKPQDYQYEDNIGYINWVDKAAQVNAILGNMETYAGILQGYADSADQIALEAAEAAAPQITLTEAANGVTVTVADKDGNVLQSATVKDGESGPAGPRGLTGARGERGEKGDPGSPGERGSEGPAGPRGLTGPIGPQGQRGETGSPGEQGPAGPRGERGPQGDAGVGVPTGGTTGQVLAKRSGTNYDTEWVDQTGGGASITVDSALSTSSTNPVQNKVLKAALDGNVSLLQDAIKREQINVISLESGTFQDADGTTKIPYAPRLRNTVPIPINKYSKIEIPDGYGMWIFRLNKDLQLISAVGAWKTGTVDVSTILVEAIEYINIAIRKTATPTADISADLSTVQSGIHFEYAPDAVKKVLESETEKRANNARYATGNNGTPLTFLHFSDIHYDTSALKRIMANAEDYSDLIDEYICTGDMVGNTAGQISSWWDENVLTCIGNHDTASYANDAYDWTALSMADRDAYYIAPFESNWGITHTSGKSYYYKDYATQNVRLIVMDSMLYTDNGQEATDQTTWLSGLLSSAVTNNLHVLIAIHSPHGGAAPVDCSFSKYGQTTMPTYANCNTPQAVVDAVASAITGGLHFIGYLVGHMHQDAIWDAENDGTQLMYCVTCASTKANQWAYSDQDRSGDFADAFNLVTIDTANTLVKIVRGGGADIDNHLRERKAICFNYSTGENVTDISMSGYAAQSWVQNGYQPKAITDAGGYYTTDTVEGALQELGAELAGINTLIGSGVIT